MAMDRYRRRVGSARPSHLMYTGGIGGLVDLPNFSVLVQGLDEWRFDGIPDFVPIDEPRLLAAVRAMLSSPGLAQLRPAPWMEGRAEDPTGPAGRIGVPVMPFPSWFRCTQCNYLGSLAGGAFRFVNDVASRPHDAQFRHRNCRRKDRYAVPARFLVGCLRGHLDDFPYASFVHHGGQCTAADYPTLEMVDFGANAAAAVQIRCKSCNDATRTMLEAQGMRGMAQLPRCRGRHAHLSRFEDCGEPSRLLVLGASNQWFAELAEVLSVPLTEAGELGAAVDRMWERLQVVTMREVLEFAMTQPQFVALSKWPLDLVWSVVEARRARESGPASGVEPGAPGPLDLLTPEWDILTKRPFPADSDDFTARDSPVPEAAAPVVARLVQVERLRLVRALVGFTRFDAPDPEEPEAVARAPLGRDSRPEWVPASEVRGEGVFVQLHDDVISSWESRVEASEAMRQHYEAYGRFRRNRYSDRIQGPGFDPYRGWPGPRYYLLHTLSHVLLRAIALDCGYSAASLAERVYAGERAGVLIYTAVPDAEGTLGGLVSQGQSDHFARIVRRGVHDAMACSSDPLCAERVPDPASDTLHAAACHICLFLSETSCERGNRFLDRRLLVPVGDHDLALLRAGDDLLS